MVWKARRVFKPRRALLGVPDTELSPAHMSSCPCVADRHTGPTWWTPWAHAEHHKTILKAFLFLIALKFWGHYSLLFRTVVFKCLKMPAASKVTWASRFPYSSLWFQNKPDVNSSSITKPKFGVEVCTLATSFENLLSRTWNRKKALNILKTDIGGSKGRGQH